MFAKSAAVSVKAQKYGGLFFQPMGRHKGKPIKVDWAERPGRTTANSRATCGVRRTR
jgi:hypothetical protein